MESDSVRPFHHFVRVRNSKIYVTSFFYTCFYLFYHFLSINTFSDLSLVSEWTSVFCTEFFNSLYKSRWWLHLSGVIRTVGEFCLLPIQWERTIKCFTFPGVDLPPRLQNYLMDSWNLSRADSRGTGGGRVRWSHEVWHNHFRSVFSRQKTRVWVVTNMFLARMTRMSFTR